MNVEVPGIVVIIHAVRHEDVDAANGVHQLDHGAHVEQHIAIDRDVQKIRDNSCGKRWAAIGVGRVDFKGAMARDGHARIARNREHPHLIGVGIEAREDHAVGVAVQAHHALAIFFDVVHVAGHDQHVERIMQRRDQRQLLGIEVRKQASAFGCRRIVLKRRVRRRVALAHQHADHQSRQDGDAHGQEVFLPTGTATATRASARTHAALEGRHTRVKPELIIKTAGTRVRGSGNAPEARR